MSGLLILRNLCRICVVIFWFGFSVLVKAETSAESSTQGLQDFRGALSRLKSSGPIAVNSHFKLFGRSGENDDLIEREGLLNLRLEDGADGLHAVYSPELIAQLHAEELAKNEDENVKNSALNAVGQFNYWEWRELLYPAAQMELMLGSYHFVKEEVSQYDGMPVRLLTFKKPFEKIDPGFRKYVKKYKNTFKVWIDDDGIPLASRSSERGTGRVFIIIGFKFKNEIDTVYQQRGDRLIAIRRELKDESSGATMQSQRHFVITLDPSDPALAGTSY